MAVEPSKFLLNFALDGDGNEGAVSDWAIMAFLTLGWHRSLIIGQFDTLCFFGVLIYAICNVVFIGATTYICAIKDVINHLPDDVALQIEMLETANVYFS